MQEINPLLERRICPICVEECNLNSKILPCKHQMHSECLNKTIKNNILKCPECSKIYIFLENGKIITESNLSKNCRKYFEIIYNGIIFLVKFFFILFLIFLFIGIPIYSIIDIIITGKYLTKHKNQTLSEKFKNIGLLLIFDYAGTILIFLGICLIASLIKFLLFKIGPYFFNVEINLVNLPDIDCEENL